MSRTWRDYVLHIFIQIFCSKPKIAPLALSSAVESWAVSFIETTAVFMKKLYLLFLGFSEVLLNSWKTFDSSFASSVRNLGGRWFMMKRCPFLFWIMVPTALIGTFRSLKVQQLLLPVCFQEYSLYMKNFLRFEIIPLQSTTLLIRNLFWGNQLKLYNLRLMYWNMLNCVI